MEREGLSDATAWKKKARHLESRAETESHGLSKNLDEHANVAALLHREFAEDIRRLADRERILRWTLIKV